jgi:TolA-binding protein
MRRALGLVGLGLLCAILASCSNDQDAGRRYRAERELWQADFQRRELSVRPRDVKKEQWLALAQRYEEIADRHAKGMSAPSTGSQSRQDLQTVSARALFTAAQLYGSVGDSTRVDQIFGRMAGEFSGLPAVAAEVALAQGSITQRRGQFGQAADLYQSVVDRVKPDPESGGAAGMVVDLPVTICRLRTRAANSTPATGGRPYYDTAREWYERVVRENPGSRTQLAAQEHLGDIAADLGDWPRALSTLQTLEDQLNAIASPPRDPAEVRMARAGIQTRATKNLEQARETLASVLQDYPKSPAVPQALHALALNAYDRKQLEEALGYLDRLTTEYKENPTAAAQGVLTRARMLESRDRWGEALDAYRSLPMQYPLTEPALLAPLEIAAHYGRAKDQAATATALEKAASDYHDFVTKYPPGPQTAFARQQLARTLALQKKYDEAITEMVSLGQDLAPSETSVALLTGAATMAYREMADSLKAADILERMGKTYEGSQIGQWASTEALRLRGTKSP